MLLLGGEKSPAGFGRVLDGIQACLTRVERRVIIIEPCNAAHERSRIQWISDGFCLHTMSSIN